MSTNIEGKVVVITGASSGLGESTARLLASSGAKVVLGARRKVRIDALVKEITAKGGSALGFKTDVTMRLVNAASLPPDVEIASGWDACLASMVRPAAQERIKTLMERGFHKPGDAENRLGYYVGQLGR